MSIPRVLVVDDHPDTLQLFDTYLSFAGFAVTATNSAAHAIEIASGPFDAVTTDLAMPGMDGHELIRRLHTLHAAHPIPIVVVSGQVLPVMPAGPEGVNCCRLFKKPCELEALADTLHALIETCPHDCRRCLHPAGA